MKFIYGNWYVFLTVLDWWWKVEAVVMMKVIAITLSNDLHFICDIIISEFSQLKWFYGWFWFWKNEFWSVKIGETQGTIKSTDTWEAIWCDFWVWASFSVRSDCDMTFTNITSGQPGLRTECLRGRPFPPPPINRGDNLLLQKCRINSQQCWSSVASLLTVDPLTVDCWSSIASLLTFNPLTVDCWSLIASLLTFNPLIVDRQPSHCWLLIASLLTADSPPPPPPPGSTVNSVDHQLPHYWLLIVDRLTVDRRPSHCWLSTLPPTDSNFVIFNILILSHLSISTVQRPNGKALVGNFNHLP